FAAAAAARNRRALHGTGVVLGLAAVVVSGLAIARAVPAFRSPKISYDDRFQNLANQLSSALDKEDVDGAGRIGRAMLALHGDDPVALYFTAHADAKEGACGPAVERYRAAIAPGSGARPESVAFVDGNQLRIRLAITECLVDLGKKDEALAEGERF